MRLYAYIKTLSTFIWNIFLIIFLIIENNREW